MKELFPDADRRQIPCNLNQVRLLTLRPGITLESLGLKGTPKADLHRDWSTNNHFHYSKFEGLDVDSIPEFIGAFIQTDDDKELNRYGDQYYLVEHDGVIDVACGHNIYLWQKRDDLLKSLGLTLNDASWINPYINNQIEKQRLTTCRLVATWGFLIGTLIWQPFYWIIIYCAISYISMAWMIFSGELVAPTERSIWGNILVGAITIFLAPLFFAWMLFLSCFLII